MLRKWNLLVPTLTTSVDGTGRMIVHGIASSTVRDRHGDTMTENALRSMERKAVGTNVYLNHEWKIPDDLAGTVVAAQVKRAEDGVYELHTDTAINKTNPKAVETWQAMDGGAKLGISIEAMIPEGAATRDKAGGFIFNDIDLMGSSFVAHPANTRSWTEYLVRSLTGHLPDKFRELEERRGRDFYLKGANQEAVEAFGDDDAESLAATPDTTAEAPEPEVTLDADITEFGTPADAGTEVIVLASPVLAEADGIVKEGIEAPADGTPVELLHAQKLGLGDRASDAEFVAAITHGGMDDAMMRQAIDALDRAIALHQAHMDGTEPTSEVSQQRLMGLIKEARDALGMTQDKMSEPELTDTTTTIQHPDGTTVRVSSRQSATSQDTSGESPDTGSGEVEDDNGLDNEALLDDRTTKAMTAMSHNITETFDGQSTLIRSLTTQVIDLTKRVTLAESSRDAALALARDAITDTDKIVNRLLDSPVGRRMVAREAVNEMAHLKAIYGDQIIETISTPTKR